MAGVKQCFKCLAEKPLDDFYTHPEMADGHLNKCKACTKRDVSNYWHEHANVLRQTDLARRKLKRAVNIATGNAVRDGRIIRSGRCHYCAATDNLEAHHWDYYRPLDVTWLCKRCHRIADMARRDAEVRVAVLLKGAA